MSRSRVSGIIPSQKDTDGFRLHRRGAISTFTGSCYPRGPWSSPSNRKLDIYFRVRQDFNLEKAQKHGSDSRPRVAAFMYLMFSPPGNVAEVFVSTRAFTKTNTSTLLRLLGDLKEFAFAFVMSSIMYKLTLVAKKATCCFLH